MIVTPTITSVQPQEADVLVKYLIFPIIVVILGTLASFFATFYQKRRFANAELKSKTNNLLDNLIIDLTTLIEVFEKLKTDIEERSIYYIKNVNIGNESIKHIRLYIDDIYLLNDENLRRRLIECVDSAGTLFSDIFSLETYAIERNNEYVSVYKASRKELRRLHLKLIKQDLTISDNGYVGSLLLNNIKLTKEERERILAKVASANKIISEVHEEQRNNESGINAQISRDEKRRLSFNFRLLDIQTKIREILFQLSSQRNK